MFNLIVFLFLLASKGLLVNYGVKNAENALTIDAYYKKKKFYICINIYKKISEIDPIR